MNKILIATDGSPAATDALTFGLELATRGTTETRGGSETARTAGRR